MDNLWKNTIFLLKDMFKKLIMGNTIISFFRSVIIVKSYWIDCVDKKSQDEFPKLEENIKTDKG